MLTLLLDCLSLLLLVLTPKAWESEEGLHLVHAATHFDTVGQPWFSSPIVHFLFDALISARSVAKERWIFNDPVVSAVAPLFNTEFEHIKRHVLPDGEAIFVTKQVAVSVQVVLSVGTLHGNNCFK